MRPDAENLEDRYRGIVSLPKMLLPKGEALKQEADRSAAKVRACPPVPAGGPGKKEFDRIVGEARRVGKVHDVQTGLEGLAAGAILTENSRTGGRWDIKNLRDTGGQKRYPKAQEFGDMLYGATSTAMGFSPFVSDLGADLYSLWTNGEPEDKDAWIHNGQVYARMKCDQR